MSKLKNKVPLCEDTLQTENRSASIQGLCKGCQHELERTPRGSPFQQYELEKRGFCSVVCGVYYNG